jgi:hypothetical protein
MAFTENLKAKVRQRANFKCCLCRSIGIHIHHIVPQGEGGLDVEDNAAPLCPSCHDIYGANPSKRKFVKEARDNWYKICDQSKSNEPLLSVIKAFRDNTASKEDLEALKREMIGTLSAIISDDVSIPTQNPDIVRNQSCSELDDFQSCTLKDIITHVYTKSEGLENKDFIYNLIFDEACWFDEELLAMRNDFIKIFGEETAKRICLINAHLKQFDVDEGFTEDDFVNLLRLVHIEVALWIFYSDGILKAKIDSNGVILWKKVCRKRGQVPVELNGSNLLLALVISE